MERDQALAVVDGTVLPLAEARIPVTDPALTVGWSVFETLLVERRSARALGEHLDRLAGSAHAAGMGAIPREAIEREVALLVSQGPENARLRITLTGGGHRILWVESLDLSRVHQPIRAVRGPHRDEPILGGSVKHGSRAPWVVALRRSGADEVLLVDQEDRFTEGTTSAILAVMDGAVHLAPEDGRILPSTMRHEILARARQLGVDVVEQGPPAYGPWDGLYIASSTRDLAPVVSLDGQSLPGWEAVGRRLASFRRPLPE